MVRTYLHGPRGPEYERIGNNNPSWYIYDGLRSVVGLVDQNGNRTSTRKYDVYGGARGSTGPSGSKHRVVGGLSHPSDDETGLIYMRARHYDPVTGRFLSEGPAQDVSERFKIGREMYRDLIAVGLCLVFWIGGMVVLWIGALRYRPALFKLLSEGKSSIPEEAHNMPPGYYIFCRYVYICRSALSGLVVGAIAEHWPLISILLAIANLVEMGLPSRRFFGEGIALNALFILLGAVLGFQIRINL